MYFLIVGVALLLAFYLVGIVEAVKKTKEYIGMWEAVEKMKEAEGVKILKRAKWVYFIPSIFSWITYSVVKSLQGEE